MVENIRTLTKYNLWANRKIADWLLSNDSNKLDEFCKSSFTTIRLTIKHIFEAQVLYFNILKLVSLTESYNKSESDIIKELVLQSEEFATYSCKLEAKELNSLRNVKFPFLEGDFTQAELIQHCMNHSTYHRGQIITMGHQLVLTKAPSTDLLFYLSKIKKIS